MRSCHTRRFHDPPTASLFPVLTQSYSSGGQCVVYPTRIKDSVLPSAGSTSAICKLNQGAPERSQIFASTLENSPPSSEPLASD